MTIRAVGSNSPGFCLDPSPPTRTLSLQGPAPYGLLVATQEKVTSTESKDQPHPSTSGATDHDWGCDPDNIGKLGALSSPNSAKGELIPDPETLEHRMVRIWKAIIRGHQQRAHEHSQHRRPTPLRLWGVLQLGEYIVLLLAMGSSPSYGLPHDQPDNKAPPPFSYK